MSVALIAACGSNSRQSGFDDEKSDQDGTQPSGPFGSSGAPGKNDDLQCAKAEAEAKQAPVDVIISVDQSGSMSDDLQNVKANINQLSQFLKATGLDYRVVMIGEIGNDTYQICVPPPLGGPGCASNGKTYRAVDQHLESNDTLNHILMTLDQTGGTRAWKDFLRPDAVKAFVPITDDDSYLMAPQFDSQLLAKPGALFGTQKQRRYVFYPIVGAAAHPSESTCGFVAVNNGSQYLELAKLTKGKWFPICLTNFGPVFQEIAKNVADVVACELAIPKPSNGQIIDYEKVNVNVTPAKGGSAKPVDQDSSKQCDGGADGWQYNADKTKILLCGSACEAVRSDPGAKVSVQFGCETRVK